jgi:hypothetical protein
MTTRSSWTMMLAVEGFGTEVLVQYCGQEECHGKLRYRGQQEDADRVEQGVPEEAVLEDFSEVLQAHEVSLAFEEVPVEEADHEGVDQREQSYECEEDKERCDVEVGRCFDVEDVEPLFEGGFGFDGRQGFGGAVHGGCHWALALHRGASLPGGPTAGVASCLRPGR